MERIGVKGRELERRRLKRREEERGGERRRKGEASSALPLSEAPHLHVHPSRQHARDHPLIAMACCEVRNRKTQLREEARWQGCEYEERRSDARA